jgi:predicted DNA-binding transcriptional regulator YafY
MRKSTTSEIIFSPTDLIRFMQSPFASWMDRYNLERPGELIPDAVDAQMKIIASAGDRHEQEYLQKLKSDGVILAEIVKGPDFAISVAETTKAVRDRAPVIYQGALQYQNFAGYSDFLILGRDGYEVWDTKLGRSPRPYYLIQLCCYAEMLEHLTRAPCATVGVILVSAQGRLQATGDPLDIRSFKTNDYRYYYQTLKCSFLRLMDEFVPDFAQRPLPAARADHGRWQSHAETWLEQADHLSRVAKITSGQIKKIEAVGTRSQIDRMNRIIILLKRAAGNKSTRDELAQFLGVCGKTVQRDLRTLTDYHGYKLERQDWQGGGIVLKDPMVPLILMDVSKREVVSVLMASRCVEEYVGTLFEAPLRSAFRKLSTLMKGLVKVSADEWDEVVQIQDQKKELCGPELFDLLARAISSKLVVSFQYLKPTKQVWEKRRVEPYLLYYSLGIWYLVAYDLNARGWRKFALARMKDTEMLALVSVNGSTKAARKLSEKGMGAFFSAKTETIRLWLDSKAAWFAAQAPWHPSQKLEARANGSALMTIEVSGSQDIIRKIMEWCPDVIVLEPASLQTQVEERLRIGQRRHRDQTFEDIDSSDAKRPFPDHSGSRKTFTTRIGTSTRSEAQRKCVKK